jgi:hypothetical protein
MKNGEIIALVALVATLSFVIYSSSSSVTSSTDDKKKNGCKRTGVVASQAEITGLQI